VADCSPSWLASQAARLAIPFVWGWCLIFGNAGVAQSAKKNENRHGACLLDKAVCDCERNPAGPERRYLWSHVQRRPGDTPRMCAAAFKLKPASVMSTANSVRKTRRRRANSQRTSGQSSSANWRRRGTENANVWALVDLRRRFGPAGLASARTVKEERRAP
jgi:hypothetical protein